MVAVIERAYFPEAGEAWRKVTPREAGFDADKLADAVAFANAHECNWPSGMYLDGGEYVGTAYVQEKPPYNTVIGEVRHRVTSTVVYDIPWLADRKDVVGSVLGGWQLSSVLNFRTGEPLRITKDNVDDYDY